jgi:hypothetical protein
MIWDHPPLFLGNTDYFSRCNVQKTTKISIFTYFFRFIHFKKEPQKAGGSFHLVYSTLNLLIKSRNSSAIEERVAEDELISSIDASCSSAEAAMS